LADATATHSRAEQRAEEYRKLKRKRMVYNATAAGGEIKAGFL